MRSLLKLVLRLQRRLSRRRLRLDGWSLHLSLRVVQLAERKEKMKAMIALPLTMLLFRDLAAKVSSRLGRMLRELVPRRP